MDNKPIYSTPVGSLRHQGIDSTSTTLAEETNTFRASGRKVGATIKAGVGQLENGNCLGQKKGV